MEIERPTMLEEALARLAQREVVPSGLDSAGWREVAVEVRERAFFSARVESARLLSGMKQYMEAYLRNDRMENGGLVAQGRQEFVALMRELALEEGIGVVDEETGEVAPIDEEDLRDVRSMRRLQLIFDTQVEAAQEYGWWRSGQDEAVLAVFPAQRFIRVRPVEEPRPIHAANEGAVRRKDDLAFWVRMNVDFEVPWGPWGFNSGMGVEDVDAEEARELGVLKEGEAVKPVERTFNEGLEAGTKGMDGGILAELRRAVGGSTAEGRIRQKTGRQKTEEERVLPRNTKLDARLVEARIASLAREDAVDLAGKISGVAIAPDAQMTEADILEAVSAAGRIFPPEITRGLRRVKVNVPGILRNASGTEIAGSYREGTININGRLPRVQQWITALHEVTHWVVEDSPNASAARRKIASHFARRTRGEELTEWKGRMYLKDRWYLIEAGRPDGSEVASYYLEMLALPSEVLANRMRQPETRETLETVMDALGITRREQR